MKKLLNLLMVLFFVASLTACGGNAEGPDAGDQEDSTATQVDSSEMQMESDSTAQDTTATEADAHEGDAHEGEH